MPRPKKQSLEARSIVFGVRLTPEERTSIERKAAASGLTPSDYCRAAVLGLQVRADPPSPTSPAVPADGCTPSGAPSPAPDTAHVVALNRVGVNLNQIARRLNSGLGMVPADLSESLARVNDLLDQWQGIA